MTWQPIDTAPKDGTVFIYLGTSRAAVSTCFWLDDELAEWWDLHGDQSARPIAWMPLPAPPATNAAASTSPTTAGATSSSAIAHAAEVAEKIEGSVS